VAVISQPHRRLALFEINIQIAVVVIVTHSQPRAGKLFEKIEQTAH